MNRTLSSGASLVLTGDNLTLADAGRILHGQIAELQVAPPARRRVEQARRCLHDLLARGETLYGVNTGFGKLASRQRSSKSQSRTPPSTTGARRRRRARFGEREPVFRPYSQVVINMVNHSQGVINMANLFSWMFVGYRASDNRQTVLAALR